ncbi:aminoglycoside phosphotransferase family protein [Paracoccus liaowanqingii]|uniref:Aminoglycoside phosphotransferase family protein n=1 Tax=Paracoccus liaowanqingii TaxID=2560053 RepID=A0A4Z1BJD2_9RHOB|nr:aminoglycoside phosphotransferase family protein [Paracoccus liaowanqingii]TGN56940.1 aminoglycoside phosphotransferase family protein [Paracoccus liaowanqingii]
MKLWPDISDEEDFERWRSASDLWLPVVIETAQRANVDAVSPTSFKTGTNLVVDLNGAAILKIFPPIYATQFAVERIALRQLNGRLSVPIPRILAEGEDNGWSWLIITKLPGTVGSEVWPVLSEQERLAILGDVGRTIAEVQAVDPGGLLEMQPAWPDFVKRQAEGCIERHRRQGLEESLLSDLPALLRAAPSVLPAEVQPVILTGEWIPENLLLTETSDGWQLAAVIDFGDVMTGWREYDLLGPSTFMCAGVLGRLRAFLEGYGVPAEDYDDAMRRRLTTLMMLHRASDMRGIAISDWQSSVRKLEDLEDLIWPKAL